MAKNRASPTLTPSANLLPVAGLMRLRPSSPQTISMAHYNVNRLQSTYTCRAFGEVSVGFDQDLELAEYSDQQVNKVPVNKGGEVGPSALCEV